MISLNRTDSSNPDYIQLVSELDNYLAEKDGNDHAFYAQYNKSDSIRHVVLAYINNTPAGCGAFKEYENGVVEIKRMYVKPEFRNKGIAQTVLKELEIWAADSGYFKAILETGKRQAEAVNLYLKSGYEIIPNYGQYENVDNSVCMQKLLNAQSENIYVTDYKPEYRQRWKEINVQWITRDFNLEKADTDVLDDPENFILKDGGVILIAKIGNEVAGTCALINEGNGIYELSKMGVDERFRSKGIGKLLMEKTLEKANQMKIEKLILHSNRKHASRAIEMYRKYGFKEVPLGPSLWVRADIKMEMDLQ